MKQKIFIFFLLGTISQAVFAGGIVTNANQSAAYVRMLARDASTSIDAIYYNPAGLTKLEDGFHISLSSQSIFQKRKIESTFATLNNGKYEGDVKIPVFPNLYFAYKKEKFAIGFGIQPNSGGGTVKYDTGVPSFEKSFSTIPTSLTASGIPTTSYDASINFKGSSVFWGAQANASYALNDMISVSAGVRMVIARNKYEGTIKNITVNPTAAMYGFDGSMVAASSVFTTLSGASTTVANNIQPYVTAAPTATLDQLVAGGSMSQATADQLAAGLGSSYNAAMSISQVQGAYNQKAAYLAGNAAATADQKLDSKQKGTGFAPILGVNLSFGEKLNVGLRYEFRTKITLENETSKDVVGGVNGDGSLIYMFPDGEEIRSDIPAILSVGASYKVLPKMSISGGLHYYFDKDATIESSPGVKKNIDGNLYELSLGTEYSLTEKFLVSAGYLYCNTGVGSDYQTDLSYSLSSNTIGFGGAYKASDRININLGMLYTIYSSDSKTLTSQGTDYKETYKRTNMDFAIGIDYSF